MKKIQCNSAKIMINSRKIILVALVFIAIFYLLYQYRIFIATAIWQSQNANSYRIVAQTQEEFDPDGMATITCSYILDVQNEQLGLIELADVSCENNFNEKLSYLEGDITVSGLLRLARNFQSTTSSPMSTNNKFDISIDWHNGVPKKMVYVKNDEFYRATITVENFKIYK